MDIEFEHYTVEDAQAASIFCKVCVDKQTLKGFGSPGLDTIISSSLKVFLFAPFEDAGLYGEVLCQQRNRAKVMVR